MTMNISDIKHRSVGSIVNDNFATAQIFKSFGIDFCCGGSATLIDACRMVGVDVDRVVDALQHAADDSKSAIPFDSWPTDLLIDYVLKIHHRRIRSRGPELLALIEKVAAKHGDKHPELHELVQHFRLSLEDLENHLQKEERVLFPYCYELFETLERGGRCQPMHCGTVVNPIRQMLHEHSDEGTRYKYIGRLMNEFRAPEDACASYCLMLTQLELFMDALFEHIHIENNILFPRFVELEERVVG